MLANVAKPLQRAKKHDLQRAKKPHGTVTCAGLGCHEIERHSVCHSTIPVWGLDAGIPTRFQIPVFGIYNTKEKSALRDGQTFFRLKTVKTRKQGKN